MRAGACIQGSLIRALRDGLAAGLLLLGLCSAAAAQAIPLVPVLPLPNIDPVIAGDVDVLHRQADGRILVAGSFERVGNTPASNCARLLPDGAVDSSFQCESTATPRGFATDALGRIYVISALGLRRLTANGSADASFSALGDNTLQALLIDDELIYVSGNFTQIGGLPRNRLARVTQAGVVDPDWNPDVNTSVNRLHLHGDFLYLAGSFTQVGGMSRLGVARIALDSNSTGSVDGWDAGLTNGATAVSVISMDSDDAHLFVSGNFDQVQGLNRGALAKLGLDSAATPDPQWAPSAGSGLQVLRVIGESVYLGNGFSAFSVNTSNGFSGSTRMVRLSRDGAALLDSAFTPFSDVTSGAISAGIRSVIAGDGGGRLFIGGVFDALSQGDVRLALAALNADGSVDELSAMPEALRRATLNQVALPADGALYVQGNFRRVNGVLRRNLIRMLPGGGSVDSGFRPADVSYSAVAVAGNQLYVADETQRRLLRLDPLSGDIDVSFTPIPYSQTVSVLSATPTHLYLLGNFSLTGITPALTRIARLDLQSGSIDSSFRFATNAGGSILGIVRDATSASLFLYGNFSSINSVPLTHLARIDEGTAALDETFLVNINGSLRHILSDAQGGLWLSGGFNQVNGAACVTPARLLIAAGGQLDPAFTCARPPQGAGHLAFARGAIHAAVSNRIRRYRLSDAGVADPDWELPLPSLSPLQFQSVADTLLLHGNFNLVNGVNRGSLAAVPQQEQFLRNGFE